MYYDVVRVLYIFILHVVPTKYHSELNIFCFRSNHIQAYGMIDSRKP